MNHHKLILPLLLLLLLFSESRGEEPFWELVSMSPPRGEVLDIEVLNNELYSAGYGGIFKSNNDGESWHRLLDEIVTSIGISNNILFARVILKTDLGYNWSFYKSTDNGNNWIEIKPDTISSLTSFKMIIDNNHISAFYRDGLGNVRIFFSTNSGSNWNSTAILKPNNKIRGFIDCYKKNNVIAVLANGSINGTYLYISRDTGKTWLEKYSEFSIYDLNIENDSNFFGSTKNGIYETNDSGTTWNQKWLSNEFIIKLLILKKVKRIYAVSYYKGLFYSDNLGENWHLSDEILDLNENQKRINSILSISNLTYIAPQTLGIYSTRFFWYSWEEKNAGFSGSSASDFIFNNKNIFMSSWGIFNSKDEGHNFDFLGYKAYATGPIVVNSKGDIFIGNLGALGTTNDIFRSTDGGKTWENKTTGAATVNAIVINSKDVLFIEPGYRSTDNGETWQDLGLECSFLAINNEDHVFAFRDGTIYRSTDDGVSWEKQLSVDCDPTFMEREGRILFNNKTKTAAYSILPRNLDSCCFITTDNGRSWQLSKTLSLTSSSNTAVDSLYCWVKAGSRGIARSCDNGLTWQYLDTTGLKHKEFGPIGVSPDGHIYVFGSTGGLYRSRDAFVGTPGEDFLNRKIFISSHPNPFRQSTTIEFYIYFEDIITIALYNTIGEKVKTMVDNEFYFQGFNKVEVPTDGLPSGIYFCRLESKRLRETLKIIKVD